MNLDSLSFALSQVNYLVQSLSKKNYDKSVGECKQLVSLHGKEVERHLLRCLLSKVPSRVSPQGSPQNQKGLSPPAQFLTAEIARLLPTHKLPSLLTWCLENPISSTTQLSPKALLNFIKLTPLQEIVLCIGLYLSGNGSALTETAASLIKEKLPNYTVQLSQVNKEKDSELLHFLLVQAPKLSLDLATSELITKLREALPQDACPVFLLPLLHPTVTREEEVTVPSNMAGKGGAGSGGSGGLLEGALPDLVMEMGYNFTSSVDECRASLLQLGGREMFASTIAKVIGVMVRTHTGLEDSTSLPLTGPDAWDKQSDKNDKTWNIEIFVKVLHELQTTLNWKEIIYELDHPNFIVKDRKGLILLMKALKLGLQTQGYQGLFPIDLFYRHWKNTEGQASLFQMILRNSDVFSFAEQHCHTSATDVLKVPPDFSNKEVATWRSLDLIETLLYLADSGLQTQVQDMLSFPKKHCPDLLVLGLLQINPPITVLRQELLSKLFRVFLASHPNSNVILTYAWHSQSIQIKPILILSMADWYLKAPAEGDSEQNRLSRILDIAQDLKALNLMLNTQPFGFVLDLAILSSRREYLNLQKWLEDKCQEHGEAFVAACVKFLQRKIPSLLGPAPLKEDSIKQIIPLDCLATLISALEDVATQLPLSQDLYETIRDMVSLTSSVLANAASTAAPSAPGPRPGLTLPQPPQVAGAVRPGAAPGAGGLVGPPGPLAAPLAGGPQARHSLPPSLFPGGGGLADLPREFAGLQLGGGAGTVTPTPSTVTTPGSVAGAAVSMPPHSAALAAAAGFSNLHTGGLGPLVSGPGSPNRMPGYNSAGLMPGGSASGVRGLSSANVLDTARELRQGSQQNNISNLLPELDRSITREVEDEANSYFQKIYNHPSHPTLSIDEVLEILKRFQTSQVQREQDVFNCMIKNLFEEYKFFPQYPDKELNMTAQLFGGIIEHGLVTIIHLGLALRFVLDALRKPVDTKMYWFGIVALDRFKPRLKEYSKYCQHVATIPHYKEFPPHLISWVDYGSQSSEPPNRPMALVIPPALQQQQQQQQQQQAAPVPNQVTGGAAPANKNSATTTNAATTSTIVRPTTSAIGSVTQGRLSIANTTNIDTLLQARQKEQEVVPDPPQEKQDKVAFIFNNLSMINVKPKTEDIKEVFKVDENPNEAKWLAKYIVMNRVTIEPNFHKTYRCFLDSINSEKLYTAVIVETYTNINILLTADKSMANFGDRSLLKNLGHFLGLILLARNKPILMMDLDMKQLIIEAYHNGQQDKPQELLYVVPFVAKVLESASKSKVFKPPCPWTMGLMNLLAELHAEPDLKLNLKFEIEVLCKTLTLEIADLRPGNALKDYQRLGKLLSFKGFGQNAQADSQAHKKDDYMPRGALPQNFGAYGPSLTQAPVTLGPTSAGGVFAGAPGGGGGVMLGSGALPPPQPGGDAGTSGMLQPPMGQPPTSHMDQNVQSKVEGLGLAGGPVHPPAAISRPVEPKFHYLELNTNNLGGLAPHITIDPRILLLKEHPELNQLIKLAIEKSVNEWISPVIERAIKIAVTTCEQIVKKDFALDCDETRMKVAAHSMVRNLTSAMAMITCRDHILTSIKNHLKNIIVSVGRSMLQQSMESLDVIVNNIANDNVELCCAFIQKKAVEKAVPEIDKRLNVESELRKLARKEGRRYCDPVALTYQAERMPEIIRSKVGQVPTVQHAVYDEYARNIPGFKPLTDAEATSLSASTSAKANGQDAGQGTQLTASDESWAILDEVNSKLQPFIEQCTGLPTQPHMAGLTRLLETIRSARNSREVATIVVLIQKAVENLLEGMMPSGMQIDGDMLTRFRDANLLVLKALADQRAYGPNWVGRQVTAALIDSREEIKWNIDAVDALIRSQLINLYEYDKYLAACLEDNVTPGVVNFAMILVKLYLIDDRSNAQLIESDLFGTIEMLVQISNSTRNPPEGLVQIVDIIKMSSERIEHSLQMSGPTAQLHSGIQQAREYEDPPGLLEKTEYLLREWVNMYHSPSAGKDSTKAFTVFVQQMNLHGLLKTDDLITRFFRMSTQMCVDLCYRALSEQNNAPSLVRAKCFHTLDAFVRLIALLVKHSGDQQNTITKVNLLNKVLGIVAGVLLIDHEVRRKEFQQVPYHRIFIMLYLELNAPDQILETINFQVLSAYCNMLNILRPAKAPGFAYAWLEIVSHRVFIGRILSTTPQQKGWPMYAQLLTALFKFLSPFLRNAELAKPVQRLYRGTLRVLLVLLHDFPEFLCDYHYGFCDVIPPNCIQMRNLILSAFPRSMRLPDPFTPNLKVDMLPEISIAPRMVNNFAVLIKPSFKKDLDSYLKNRTPVSFLSELRTNLQVSNEPGMRYNISMMNALVMYVGTQAIQFIRGNNNSPSMSSIAHSSHMDIFQNLAVDLDTEGRYLFLNCIANQLRYPNSHTHYFSCLMLYLFAEANTESIQEQITRVLLERLIVNRPHPWGLLITFIELIKNPNFNFWEHEFVQCAPEIQKLFESVARSCMVASQPRQEPAAEQSES